MATQSEEKVLYDDFDDPSLDAFVNEALQEFSTPGLAILVIHGDRTWAKGYGYADIDNKVPVTPQTLFSAGSLTKSFTASMAAHLVESSDHPSVTWETPIAELIRDDFVLASGTRLGQWATERITIEDALSHRTGMPRHDMARVNGDPSTRDLVRSLRYLPLKDDLRAKWAYCNIMYTVIVHALEVTLKQPFGELLKEHIFHPLGMRATTYSITDAKSLVNRRDDLQLARGYLWNSNVETFELVPWESMSPSHGGGGIVSNVLDFSRWIRHLMRPCNLNSALSDKTVKALRTPTMLKKSDPAGPFLGSETYGLGLYLAMYRGKNVVWHGGAASGHMSTMLMVPPSPTEAGNDAKASGWAVMVMQNGSSKARGIVAWHLLDKFLQTPENERRDMITAARNAERKKQTELEPVSVVQRLYGALDPSRVLPPALPLTSYGGLYRHVAYHHLRVSLLPLDLPKEAPEDELDSTTGWRLHLQSGSQKSYLDISSTLHHVSGEWWWAHQSIGPRNWLTDSTRKLQFMIGAGGKVEGLRTQAEPAMGNELAFFERVR